MNPSPISQNTQTNAEIILDTTVQYIQRALNDKAIGSSREYYKMMDTLKNGLKEPRTLMPWMHGFSHIVSQLDRRYPDVAEFWLSVDWTREDEAFMHNFEEFVCSLVSAHPFNGLAVTKMLVNTLTGGMCTIVMR
jgi:hypothetical protein